MAQSATKKKMSPAKLRRVQVALEKEAEGGKLTKAQERDLKEYRQSEPEKKERRPNVPPDGEMTGKALAESLGMSENHLYRIRRKESDAPAVNNLEVWKEYMASRDNFNIMRPCKSREEWQTEKTRLECVRLGIQIEQLEGELIEVEQLDKIVQQHAMKARSKLYNLLDTLPGNIEGESKSEIRKILQEAFDSVCDGMSSESYEES